MHLDLLRYHNELRLKTMNQQRCIFDPIRRKYVVLEPEELVRQLLLYYLVHEKSYPKSRIRIELALSVNKLQKRCDILIFDEAVQPWLLVECKAAHIELSQATFDQAARYNMALGVAYLAISNGRTTYCCKMDYERQSYDFMGEFPDFGD